MASADLLERVHHLRGSLSDALSMGMVRESMRESVVQCGIELDAASEQSPDRELRALIVRAETLLGMIGELT